MIKRAMPGWLIYTLLLLLLVACQSPNTQPGQNTPQSSEPATGFQIQHALDALPYAEDPSQQIVILAQDGDQPVKITQEWTFPKNLTLEKGDYSFTPTRLPYISLPPLTSAQAQLRYQQELQQVLKAYDALFNQIWEALIQAQHTVQKQAQQDHQKALKQWPADSAEYKAQQNQTEAMRKHRLQSFALQRQYIQEASEFERQEIETALRKKYQLDPDFSIQSCWIFDCMLKVGVDLGAAWLQNMFNIVVSSLENTQADPTLIQQSKQELAQTQQKLDEAFEALRQGINFNISTPEPNPTPSALLDSVDGELKGHGAYTHQEIQWLNKPAKQAAQNKQVTETDENQRPPQVMSGQMLWDTIDFLSNHQADVPFMSVPITARDIFTSLKVKLAQDQGFNLNLDSQRFPLSECPLYLNDIEELKRVYAQVDSDINKTRCGVALRSLFYHLDNLDPQQYNQLVQALPAFLRSHNSFQDELNRLVRVQEANGHGQISLHIDLNKDMLGHISYSPHNQTAADWLYTLLEDYYPEALANGQGPAVRHALDMYTMDKDFVLVIESPERCSQNLNTVVEASKGFGGNGFGGFYYSTSSESFLFDGDYTFRLTFRDRKDPHWAIDPEGIVAIKVPVTRLMGLSVPELVSKGGVYDSQLRARQYPLTLSDFTGDTEQQTPNDVVAVQLKNRTANFFDLKMSPVVANPDHPCPPAYFAGCLNYNEATFRFNHRNYQTGLFELATRYSHVPDPFYAGQTENWNGIADEPVNIKGWYTNRRPGMENYRFLVLQARYNSFARRVSKPARIERYAEMLGTPGELSAPLKLLGNYPDYHMPPIPEAQNQAPPAIANPTPLILDSIPAADNRPGPQLIQRILSRAKASSLHDAGISTTSNFASQRLLNELAQGEQQPYDGFNELHLTQCQQNDYIQVGAVVDLSNYDANANKALYDKNQTIPMLLNLTQQIDGKVHTVRSWTFDARIGSQTLVERYWDGRTGDSQGLPSYTPNEYRISVHFDNRLNKDPQFNASFRRAIGAHLTHPIVLSSSTQARVRIDQACDASLSGADNWQLTQSQLDLIKQYVAEAQAELAIFEGLDPQASADRTSLLMAHYHEVNDFGLAQQPPPNYATSTQALQQLLRNMQHFNIKLAHISEQLQVLDAEGGLSANSDAARQAKANLRSMLEEFPQAHNNFRAPDGIRPDILRHRLRAFTRLARLSWISLGAHSSADQCALSHTYLGQSIELLQRMGETYYEVHQTLANQLNQGLGSPTISSPQTYAKSFLVNKIHQDHVWPSMQALAKGMIALSDKPATEGCGNLNPHGQVVYTNARQTMTRIFELINRFKRADDPCVQRYASADFYDRLMSGTKLNHDVSEEELKCRICQMRDEPTALPADTGAFKRKDFDILLRIRKAFITQKEDGIPGFEDISFQLGFSQNIGVLGTKTFGFSWLPSENQLFVAFSGEDKLESERNPKTTINDDAYKQLQKKMQTRIATALKPTLTLSDQQVVLAQEAQNLAPNRSRYKSLKNNQNDAEIKLLETISRRWPQVSSAYVYSDRVTCEYCQEVAFRINTHLPPDLDYPGGTFDQIYMYGEPLYSSERLAPELIDKGIQFIENIQTQGKTSMCGAYP